LMNQRIPNAWEGLDCTPMTGQIGLGESKFAVLFSGEVGQRKATGSYK
jgi:hypothetical protein